MTTLSIHDIAAMTELDATAMAKVCGGIGLFSHSYKPDAIMPVDDQAQSPATSSPVGKQKSADAAAAAVNAFIRS